MKKTLIVDGMSCGHCEKAVKNALEEIQGVESVVVDLASKTVVVEGQDLNDEVMKEAIDDAGYDVVKID